MKDRGKKKKNVSRQHHFVPRWYLQHWCGPNERVFRARKTPSGILFDEQLPTNIGREKDLNTIFTSSGPGKHLEDQVTRILDDPFSVLHRKMITEGVDKLTDDERFEVARHLCALQIRNPRIIRDQIEPGLAPPSDFPYPWLTIKERMEMKRFDQRFRKSLNSGYDLAKFAAHGMLVYMLDEYANILAPKNWIVLPQRPGGVDMGLLITGELPFVATQGFGAPKSAYIFPMTPSFALVLHEDLKYLLDHLKVDKPWGFAILNFCIVSNNREVYFRNPGHRKFIERFLGTQETLPKDQPEREHATHKLSSDLLLSIRDYMIGLGIDITPYTS
jgi:hypothetical protein